MKHMASGSGECQTPRWQGSVGPSSGWAAPDTGLGKPPAPSWSAGGRGHAKNEQVRKHRASGPTADMESSHFLRPIGCKFERRQNHSHTRSCSLWLRTLVKILAQAPTNGMRWIRRFEGVQPSRHATKARNCFFTSCGVGLLKLSGCILKHKASPDDVDYVVCWER